MHHDGIARADPFENAERLAAGQHIVLADHLEPVDRRLTIQNLVIVLRAEPKPEAQEWRLGRSYLAVRKRRRGRQWRFTDDVHSFSARPARNRPCRSTLS